MEESNKKNGLEKLDSQRERVMKNLFKKRKEKIPEKEVQKERKEEFEKHKELIEEKIEEEKKTLEADPETLKEEMDEEERQIESLKGEGKLSRLLNIAQEKGVAFAVEVAKDMKDPYLLDALHDILARSGFYKEFVKKSK